MFICLITSITLPKINQHIIIITQRKQVAQEAHTNGSSQHQENNMERAEVRKRMKKRKLSPFHLRNKSLKFYSNKTIKRNFGQLPSFLWNAVRSRQTHQILQSTTSSKPTNWSILYHRSAIIAGSIWSQNRSYIYDWQRILIDKLKRKFLIPRERILGLLSLEEKQKLNSLQKNIFVNSQDLPFLGLNVWRGRRYVGHPFSQPPRWHGSIPLVEYPYYLF